MLEYVSVHALIAQSAERILGKDEVTGSNPVKSSTYFLFQKRTHLCVVSKEKRISLKPFQNNNPRKFYLCGLNYIIKSS